MSRSLTTLALLFAIVLAAALIVPAMTDWEEQRAGLETRLAEITGGPVSLAGPVSVRLLPSPRLTAARVSMEDAEGRMRVEEARLHAELSLWPLLANRVVVTQVALEGGTLRFEGDPSAMRRLSDELAVRMSVGAGEFAYLIAPGRLVIGKADAATEIEGAQLEAEWAGSDTPVRLTFRIRDRIRADTTLRPQTDGSWRVNLRATYGDELAVLSANGVLQRMGAGAPFDGDFSIVADDLRAALGAEGDGPALSLRGAVHAAGPEWSAPEVQLTLGTLQATGALAASTEEGASLEAAFTAALAELDHLGLEMRQIRSLVAGSALGGQEVPVPDWLGLDLSIRADGLVINDRVARDFRARARVADGVARLATLSGRLPGGSEVAFAPRRDRARGLTVRSESLRSLLGWLGVDVTAYPEGKLQQFDLNLAISEESDPLRLSVLDLELDGGHAEGVVSFAEDGRAVVTMATRGLDIDAYVPAAGGSFISRLRFYAGLAGSRDAAEFNLSGEQVRLAGSAVESYRFAGVAADGALVINEAEMTFAGGGQLRAEGEWAGEEAPFDLEVSGEAVDPGLFEGLPIAPAQPADLALHLTREGRRGATVEGNVRTQGLSIDLAGRQVPGNGDKPAYEGRMIARGQEQGALAGALGFDVYAAQNGAELLDVQWSGPLSGGEVTARLELAGLSALAQGSAAAPFSDRPQTDLDVQILARSAADLVAQMGGPAVETLRRVTVTADGRLRRTDTGWALTVEEARAGDTPFGAALRWADDGPLEGRFDLDRLTLTFAAREAAAQTDEGTLAWSTAPFDLDWMETFRGDLEFSIATLNLGRVPFKDVAFELTADGDGIAVSGARGTMGGGLLTGSAELQRDQAALSVSAEFAGEDVPVRDFAAAAGLPPMTGPLTLAAQLRTRGRSPFDLVAGLEGRLDLGLTDGALTSVDLGHLMAALPNVRTRRSLREAANEAVSQGDTSLVRLEGVVPVSRGVFDLEGLTGVSETGPVSVGGALDLRSDIVDVEATFQITDEARGPAPVVVAFRGAGGPPQTSIDITALQELIGDRLADTPQGLLSEDDLPEDLQELLRSYEASFPEDDGVTGGGSAPEQTP